MKISFCTSCAQRLYQLERTWKPNLELIKNNPHVEWVVLNYDGDDKMHKFVMDNQSIWPSNFIYAKELSNHDWHMSVAKNISHQLGGGDILFNLDCDNFIGDSINVIDENFCNDVKIMHLFSGTPRDGTSGRVAIDKKLFYSLGGYDESFYPMSGQDSDILARSRAMGIFTKSIPCDTKLAIKNSKIESMKLCKKYKLTWEQFSRNSRQRIIQNLATNKLVANLEKGMTRPNVEIFRGVVA